MIYAVLFYLNSVGTNSYHFEWRFYYYTGQLAINSFWKLSVKDFSIESDYTWESVIVLATICRDVYQIGTCSGYGRISSRSWWTWLESGKSVSSYGKRRKAGLKSNDFDFPFSGFVNREILLKTNNSVYFYQSWISQIIFSTILIGETVLVECTLLIIITSIRLLCWSIIYN